MDRIQDPWGARTPYGAGESWPSRADEYTVDTPERWVPTASLLHSNGDGKDLLSAVDEGAAVTAVQLAWLRTRMKAAAPQALVVAD